MLLLLFVLLITIITLIIIIIVITCLIISKQLCGLCPRRREEVDEGQAVGVVAPLIRAHEHAVPDQIIKHLIRD